VRGAGLHARPRHDVPRVGAEHAVEDLVGRHREGDEQTYRCALVSHGGGGSIEPRNDIVDRLLGQLRQVPLSEVARRFANGFHMRNVSCECRRGNRVFPYAFIKSAIAVQRLLTAHDAAELRSRVDTELAVDAGQVRFDRLRADEERSRNVAVLFARCRQFGDPPL
jgi:hypothetical protein